MHPEVLKNLVRFKDALREELRKHTQHALQQEERSYRVLINAKTGDMRFVDTVSELGLQMTRVKGAEIVADEWWKAHLVVTVKSGKVLFTLFDASEEAHRRARLAKLAWRILCETLTVLNCKAKEMEDMGARDRLPEEAILQNLSSIDLSKPGEAIEELPGWSGSIDRIAAEARLEKKPAGTYLLREADGMTQAAIPLVEACPGAWVRFYVLTAVTEDQRIVDVLLLQTHRGWAVHQDTPDLNDPLYAFYSSLRALLLSLGPIARYPIRAMAA